MELSEEAQQFVDILKEYDLLDKPMTFRDLIILIDGDYNKDKATIHDYCNEILKYKNE